VTDEAPRPARPEDPPSPAGEFGAAGRPIGEAGRPIGAADLWRDGPSGAAEPSADAETEPQQSGPAERAEVASSEEPKDTPGWRPAEESPSPVPPPSTSLPQVAQPPVATVPHPGPAFAPPPAGWPATTRPGAMPQPGGPVPARWGQPAPAVAPPPREAWLAPRRVQAIPGTSFAVVHLDVPPATSGLAVGSLVAGIGSIVVSFVVWCFGLAGASGGWGAWVAGAFAMIAVLAGGAAIVLALLGMRQIRRAASGVRLAGRGVAIAGLVCGAVGLGLTLLGFGLSLLLQVSLQ
jgi:hypothetical protein